MATFDDINKIYQSNFGRPAEKAGADYWVAQAAANPDKDLNAWIRSSAQTDDIRARDDISTDKLDTNATWESGLNVSEVGGKVKYDAASNKWVAPKPIAPTPQSGGYQSQASRQVDAKTETIEGRIQGLLSASNPVIQQAGNRAMQQFQQRGLLNSSMAIQAANEAMTSKAIEIAGPDAATYTKTGMLNQTENNAFAGREQQFGYDMQKQTAADAARGGLQAQQDAAALVRQTAGNADVRADAAAKATENSSHLYADGVNTIEREYLAAVDIINNQDIPAATKTQRIAERRRLTNQSITAWNAASKSLSGWSDQWAVLATTVPDISAQADEPEASAQNSSRALEAWQP